MRFENKQSGADLDDHRGIKREALMSSLGCLGLGGRTLAAWARSTNFLKVFVTTEVKKNLASLQGLLLLGFCCYHKEKKAVQREFFLSREETIQRLPSFPNQAVSVKETPNFYSQCPFLWR